MKKVLAYILDVPICLLIYWFCVFILTIFIFFIIKALQINFREIISGSPTLQDLIQIGSFLFKIFVIYIYFILIPRKIGNTFGGKILKIKNNLGWRGPMQICKEYLTTWVCPTCGRRYKDDEVKFCDNCNPKNGNDQSETKALKLK